MCYVYCVRLNETCYSAYIFAYIRLLLVLIASIVLWIKASAKKLYFYFTFSHLADAFIQSDLEIRKSN